jgi:hypothetical protein
MNQEGKETDMQTEAKSKHTKVPAPAHGINLAYAGCNGMCRECAHGRAREPGAGDRFTCTAGRMNLRTDLAPDNLFGVRPADALGRAAGLARAGRTNTLDGEAPGEPSHVQVISAQAPAFGTLAGRREANTNPGQKERRRQMDWRTENAKDGQLLHLGGLAPLNADVVGGDSDLVAVIEPHNAQTVQAVARVRELAEGRERLADFDRWEEADSVEMAVARSLVTREAWDAILGLRRVLLEREAILKQMADRLRDRHNCLVDVHTDTVAAAEKRLAGERRRLEQANYGTAGGHFADLVADDESVAESADAVTAAKEAFESVASARRAVGGDMSMVKTRQREVFAAMAAA